LLTAGLVGAGVVLSPGPAGAIAVHAGPPPAGPPPASAALLAAVTAAERQITSLGAYADAQAYVKVAKGDVSSAHRAYGWSLGRWGVAKAEEDRAVVAEAAARATVNLYYQALCELGIAEYTGIAVRDNLDLASQEREVEQAELGSVAATDTAQGWQGALGELAVSVSRVGQARAVVAAAAMVVVHRKALLGRALAQLAGSRKALSLARMWVLVPGQAPAQPTAALVSLEARMGLQVQRARLVALVRATRPGTTTSASTTSTTSTAAAATTSTSTAAGETPAAASAVAAEIRQAALAGLRVDGPQILGTSVLSAAQIEAWFASTGARPNTTVPITRLIADYLKAGSLTGVRADLAFAQSVVETGYFSFPPGGQLTPKNNNFAGIGACDKCKHGWSFGSAMDGVMAQEGLLSEYAGAPPAPALFSIGAGGIEGCCTTWMSLAGVWATNPAYGFEILSVYKEMLNSALLGEEQQTGLVPPQPPGLQVPPGRPVPATAP
jgi:hypothetical protein